MPQAYPCLNEEKYHIKDMKIKLKQIVSELRTQPVLSMVSVIGTAMAIFLIMAVVMMSEIRVANYSPESHRDRMLFNTWTSAHKDDSSHHFENNGPMGHATYEALFKTMTEPEAVSAYSAGCSPALIGEKGIVPFKVDVRGTDDQYWHVFDHVFVAGAPYDKASCDARLREVVIARSVADRLFGSAEKAVGRDVQLDYTGYRVTGVVKDVNPLATKGYAQVWLPYTTAGFDQPGHEWCDGIMGYLSVAILAREKGDLPAIKAEYERNLAAYNRQIESTGWKVVSHGRPYSIEEDIAAPYANVPTYAPHARKMRYLVYMILLIVPAVNLSSMTESRLRRRRSEIGVRRAFGCSRGEVLAGIIAENLVVTIFAGIIGYGLSIIFAMLAGDFMFSSIYVRVADNGVDLTMLLHLSTFLWALGFCFVLNLLSSGIPAWKTSRINIVNAISGQGATHK